MHSVHSTTWWGRCVICQVRPAMFYAFGGPEREALCRDCVMDIPMELIQVIDDTGDFPRRSTPPQPFDDSTERNV